VGIEWFAFVNAEIAAQPEFRKRAAGKIMGGKAKTVIKKYAQGQKPSKGGVYASLVQEKRRREPHSRPNILSPGEIVSLW